jgi:hypothetical protein
MVEVSATGWSLVQRSPTECGVSQMCVSMKPRRNEEAQAHIGLSSHRKKKLIMYTEGSRSRGRPRKLDHFLNWTIALEFDR